MYRHSQWKTVIAGGCVSIFVTLAMIGHSDAADKAKIQEAIARSQQYLLAQKLSGPFGTLASLSLVKSGIDKHNATVQLCVKETLGKIQDGIYRPGQHYIYEAGLDIMLLEAIDPETYRPQMESIAAFLVNAQRPNGSWFYLHATDTDSGDTSITQYAILGLWAAHRQGIEIRVDVWERAAKWHMQKQLDDGGFAYHPFVGVNEAPSAQQQSTSTMTSAGTSNLLILRRILFGDVEQNSQIRPPEVKKRFGVLEKFVDEKADRKAVGVGTALQIGDFDKSIKSGIAWINPRLGERDSFIERFFCYFSYSIERIAALLDVEKLGTHDWYNEGADEFLRRQAPDGSWTDECTVIPSTALGLMFLSKATNSVVATKKRVSLVGGGLQIGGRGLPKDLGAIKVKDGEVSARKIVGPVDSLLVELERSADAKVEDVQAAIVEAVQLDRPEELIGQVERLRKLATDTRVEVRQTALWALGRSGDISVAPVLIRGLSDTDLSVMREASLALCILTRRLDGCGKPIDPTDDSQMDLDENSDDDKRKVRMQEWSTESTKRWNEWYLKIRPYDERDDRTTLKKAVK